MEESDSESRRKILKEILDVPVRNWADYSMPCRFCPGRTIEDASGFQWALEGAIYGPGFNLDRLDAMVKGRVVCGRHDFMSSRGECVAVQPIGYSRYFSQPINIADCVKWDRDSHDDISYRPSVIEYRDRFLEFRVGECTILNVIDSRTGTSLNILKEGECPSLLAYTVADIIYDCDMMSMEDCPDFNVAEFSEDKRYIKYISNIRYRLDCYIPQEMNMANALRTAQKRLESIGIDIRKMTAASCRVYVNGRVLEFSDRYQAVNLGWCRLSEACYNEYNGTIDQLLSQPRAYSTFADNLADGQAVWGKDMKKIRNRVIERNSDVRILTSGKKKFQPARAEEAKYGGDRYAENAG